MNEPKPSRDIAALKIVTPETPSENGAMPDALAQGARGQVEMTLGEGVEQSAESGVNVVNDSRQRYEAMITDEENRHTTYAAIGNEVIPVVDSEGKPFPVIDKEFKEFLRERYPEKYQATTYIWGFLRDLTSPDEQDDEEYRKKYPLGMPNAEFERIAKLPETNPEHQQLLKKLKKGLMGTLNFMMPYQKNSEQNKLKQLEQACMEANRMHEEYIREVYGEKAEATFGLTSDVLNENDPAKLILMAFNDTDHSPRVRFEAKRKLLDAREIGSAELKKGNGRAMNRYFKMLNQAGVFYKEPGVNTVKVYDFYLVSHHPKAEGRKCSEAYFTQTPPENFGPDWKVVQMEMRCAEVWVEDDNGEKRKQKIYFHFTEREKDTFKRIVKGMIQDSKNSDQFMEDHNGERLIFEKLKHWQPLLRHIKGCFRKQGCDPDEWDWEVSVDGREFSKVNMRTGQSQKLQIIKHMQSITFPPVIDDHEEEIKPLERHIYEQQYFDPKMYANYQFQIGLKHKQYVVNRVMESSLAQLRNPVELYGHDPLEWQIRRNIEIIREDDWQGNDEKEWASEFVAEKMKRVAKEKGEEAASAWAEKICKKFGLTLPSKDNKAT